MKNNGDSKYVINWLERNKIHTCLLLHRLSGRVHKKLVMLVASEKGQGRLRDRVGGEDGLEHSVTDFPAFLVL